MTGVLGRRILRGFCLLALHLAVMVILAAGAGSLAVWFSLEALAGLRSEAWVDSVRIFASRLGITFLLAGAAAFVLLMFPRWDFGFPLRLVTAVGERELLFITKRRISLASLAYEVSIPPTQETLGVFERTDFGGAQWLLVGGDGRQIGSVVRVAVGPGFLRYQAHIDGVPVCHFAWREKFLGGDQVEIAFAEERDRTLDKRLGLAFGVLLERHVWTRNVD